MPPTGRQRPSAVADRQPRGPARLPTYEPPVHPLNQNALNALHDLPQNHKLDSLKARQRAANSHLTQAAADINDRLQAKHQTAEKRKRRRENFNSSPSQSQQVDEGLDRMQVDTEEMTKKLDQKVRDVIDSRVEVDAVEKALKELDANAAANRGVVAPTQSTLGASQFRARDEDIEGEGENANSESQGPRVGDPSIKVLDRKMKEHREAYRAESMFEKYSSHNDYIGFKKIVHDARYPSDEAPPLPHASTWFPAEGGGRGGRKSRAQHDADDGDDMQVESERISIKCPITLLPMREPVSSTKCPHNFERNAILDMISMSEERVGEDGRLIEHGRRGIGRKAMKCPVCEVRLTADDIQTNPVLIRKIKRIQAAQNAQDEDSDDEGDDRRSASRRPRREEVTSSPPPLTMQAIKRERMSQARSAGGREVSMVPNSQVNASFATDSFTVEEGDGDEDEEDVDGDEEEEGLEDDD